MENSIKNHKKTSVFNTNNIGNSMNLVHPPTGVLHLMPSTHMVDTKMVKRSWKERLFTLPFTPFTKYRVESTPKKSYFIDGNRLIAHPETIKDIVAAIDRKNSNEKD